VVSKNREPADWVLLAYRLPREPSTPRIAVWRRLRRLGAAQLLDGLVALPLDARNRERFDWLAGEIVEAGGEATVWHAGLAGRRQERELVAAMADAVAAEYEQLIEEAEGLGDDSPGTRRRTLARLRRELRRIQDRDYFPNPARERAERAVEALARQVEEPVR
jgi:Protein ChrB, N-terminal